MEIRIHSPFEPLKLFERIRIIAVKLVIIELKPISISSVIKNCSIYFVCISSTSHSGLSICLLTKRVMSLYFLSPFIVKVITAFPISPFESDVCSILPVLINPNPLIFPISFYNIKYSTIIE